MDEATKDIEILEKHIAMLGEHYDTVQIFVTKYVENKETVKIKHIIPRTMNVGLPDIVTKAMIKNFTIL